MSTQRLALLAASAAVLLQLPAPARAADVHVQLDLGLPVAPPLVVVQPGVQVVQDYGQEVFVVGGVYWARADGRWYTARASNAPFVVVEQRRVPAQLVRLPPGQYRHWKGPPGHAKGNDGEGHGHGKRGRGYDDEGRGEHGRGHGKD